MLATESLRNFMINSLHYMAEYRALKASKYLPEMVGFANIVISGFYLEIFVWAGS